MAQITSVKPLESQNPKISLTISPVFRSCRANLSVIQTTTLINIKETQDFFAWFGICVLHSSLGILRRVLSVAVILLVAD